MEEMANRAGPKKEQSLNGRVMYSMKRSDFFLIQLMLWMAIVSFLCVPAHATRRPASNAQQIQAQPVQKIQQQAQTPQIQAQTQTIQGLEDTLYAVRYDQDPLDSRVSRLEETVFGQAQTNLSMEARVSKLKSALSPTALGPLSPTAKTAASTGNSNNNPSGASSASKPIVTAPQTGYRGQPPPQMAQSSSPMQQEATPAPGETDYPAVTQMEQKRFGKTYAQEDITQRLTRLEKNVFKTVQTGALADRVDNLRLVVLGDTGTDDSSPIAGSDDPAYQQQPYSSGGGSPLQQYRSRYGNRPPGYSQIPSSPNGGGYGSSSYNYGSQASAAPPYNGGGQQPYYGAPPDPNAYQQDPNDPTYSASGYPASNAGGSYSQGGGQVTPDTLAAMNEVEKEVLGHTYPSEPMNARLDRVETKIFKTTSPEMSTEDRMQRVLAVSTAGGAPQSPRSRAKSTFQALLPIILTILPMVLL
jgi:hypothetical protein